jgi:hypothetical protein
MGGTGSGLCKMKDKQIFFVDSDAQTTDTAAICAEAVRKTADVENIYIRPQVRAFLENGG